MLLIAAIIMYVVIRFINNKKLMDTRVTEMNKIIDDGSAI